MPLLNPHQNWLTDEEKSARDYFHGRGNYKKFQNPKNPLNLLDIKQTFLRKIKDPKMRRKVLEHYIRLNPIE